MPDSDNEAPSSISHVPHYVVDAGGQTHKVTGVLLYGEDRILLTECGSYTEGGRLITLSENIPWGTPDQYRESVAQIVEEVQSQPMVQMDISEYNPLRIVHPVGVDGAPPIRKWQSAGLITPMKADMILRRDQWAEAANAYYNVLHPRFWIPLYPGIGSDIFWDKTPNLRKFELPIEGGLLRFVLCNWAEVNQANRKIAEVRTVVFAESLQVANQLVRLHGGPGIVTGGDIRYIGKKFADFSGEREEQYVVVPERYWNAMANGVQSRNQALDWALKGKQATALIMPDEIPGQGAERNWGLDPEVVRNERAVEERWKVLQEMYAKELAEAEERAEKKRQELPKRVKKMRGRIVPSATEEPPVPTRTPRKRVGEEQEP